MTQSITGSASVGDPPNRPEGAIVVIARRGGETLQTALTILTATSRAYGAKVLVLTPRADPLAHDGGDPASPIRFLSVDPGASEASWRAQALAGTDADVVAFVDDATAVLLPWDEVAPLRLGIVRLDTAPVPDLREALERLGVPEPAQLPSRKV